MPGEKCLTRPRSEHESVHARTAAQTLDDKADFHVYSACKDTGKKIVANGDIRTKEQIVDLKKSGLYGVMIGRAAKVNPRVFEFKAELG